MESIMCPHCQSPNALDASFCEACGKAVGAATGGPRVVSGDDYAQTQAGAALQSDLLDAQAKSAAGALLLVAILQVLFGTLVIFVLRGSTRPGAIETGVSIPILALSVYGIGAIFFALYFWARRNPYPAAIVGLLFFITVHLLDALADPAALFRGLIVKIVFIAILVKAIRAGTRHRDLLKRMQSEAVTRPE